jgi:hypothetical protein
MYHLKKNLAILLTTNKCIVILKPPSFYEKKPQKTKKQMIEKVNDVYLSDSHWVSVGFHHSIGDCILSNALYRLKTR